MHVSAGLDELWCQHMRRSRGRANWTDWHTCPRAHTLTHSARLCFELRHGIIIITHSWAGKCEGQRKAQGSWGIHKPSHSYSLHWSGTVKSPRAGEHRKRTTTTDQTQSKKQLTSNKAKGGYPLIPISAKESASPTFVSHEPVVKRLQNSSVLLMFIFRSGNSIVLPTMQRAWRRKLEADWTKHDNSHVSFN